MGRRQTVNLWQFCKHSPGGDAEVLREVMQKAVSARRKTTEPWNGEQKEPSVWETVSNTARAYSSIHRGALAGAQDTDLYPRPLEKYIQVFREMEFPNIHNLIPPLFHTICLIWSHSKFYSMPA
ncbi:dynein heavy chain 11, axonemal [Egretta garzetta]|uniref:dynein heavy chain 11, axonemal n=1 Tax=Egretta garzetta TaxID=188379 RepID=UPI00163D2CCA|nr:dynein heavy chain 11, axonemal [Egretta garzetta]